MIKQAWSWLQHFLDAQSTKSNTRLIVLLVTLDLLLFKWFLSIWPQEVKNQSLIDTILQIGAVVIITGVGGTVASKWIGAKNPKPNVSPEPQPDNPDSPKP